MTKNRPQGPASPRYTIAIEPPITMQAAGFDWPYEVQVALPASYGLLPDKSYPVLWLTDGPLYFHLAVGVLNALVFGALAPEVIIVGVGCPGSTGHDEWQHRRMIDFAPPGKSMLFDGPGTDLLRSMNFPAGPQKADDLLAFFVDEVRPALAQIYRMEDDHCLMGHSGGGMFANYALFARPGAFRRFIIGSPSSFAADRAAFRLEMAHAASHSDLKADIFFGAGEDEIGQLYLAAWGVVSAPVAMAEALLLRRYPSLKVTTRIFPGKDHFSVIPDLISAGLRAVWSDRVDLSKKPFG
jgi:predicted alpha/beta superfamily hydrolase